MRSGEKANNDNILWEKTSDLNLRFHHVNQ